MKIKSVKEIKKKLIDKMKRELKSRNINDYIGLSNAHNKNKELHP